MGDPRPPLCQLPAASHLAAVLTGKRVSTSPCLPCLQDTASQLDGGELRLWDPQCRAPATPKQALAAGGLC